MRLPLRILHAALFLAPLLLAALLARVMPEPPPPAAPGLVTLNVATAVELDALFEQHAYHWPPGKAADAAYAAIPALAVQAMPDDLHALPVAKRKTVFFRALAPLIVAENRQLGEQRAFLESSFAAHAALPEAGAVTSRVRAIAGHYNVGGNLDDPRNRALLLRRVDVVPAALVLAQAANESAWGTSRFARDANNLFGMWTWDRNRGIRPKERARNARYFVRVFDNLRASVNNYLHTINIGPAYRELRELRAAQRARGEQPDAMALATGLTRYSARGEEYVDEIREIIEYNGLHDLPPLQLQPVE